jgi:hypothetical protein
MALQVGRSWDGCSTAVFWCFVSSARFRTNTSIASPPRPVVGASSPNPFGAFTMRTVWFAPSAATKTVAGSASAVTAIPLW